jgi:ADP-ribose pyrophosphatase YjhB (NUDIX family)
MIPYSAGILLYTKVDDDIYVLLGSDFKYKCWSDFGGKCEWVDNNDPMKTAAREFFEETSGIVANELTLYDKVKKYGICINCKSYHNNAYFMYLLYDDGLMANQYVKDFENQQNLLEYGNLAHNDVTRYMEKNKMRWFLLDDIISLNPMERFRTVFLTSIRNNIQRIKESA